MQHQHKQSALGGEGGVDNMTFRHFVFTSWTNLPITAPVEKKHHMACVTFGGHQQVQCPDRDSGLM